MTTALSRTLGGAITVFAAVFPIHAQTSPMRFEEISVEAPFTMPRDQGAGVSRQGVQRHAIRSEGKTGDISEAIRKAIAACHDAGGGRVVIPAGQMEDRQNPFQEQREPAPRKGRPAHLQRRSERLPARRAIELGGLRVLQLLAARLRVRVRERRPNRRRHA